MNNEEKDFLLVRIDERVEHLLIKVDKLVEKQPEQDEAININKGEIKVNREKITNSRWIFGAVIFAITVGAIIAEALNK